MSIIQPFMYTALGIPSVLAGFTSPPTCTAYVASKLICTKMQDPRQLAFGVTDVPFMSLINRASHCSYASLFLVVHAPSTPHLFPISISLEQLEWPRRKPSLHSVSSLCINIDPMLLNCHFMFLIDIDPLFKISQTRHAAFWEEIDPVVKF